MRALAIALLIGGQGWAATLSVATAENEFGSLIVTHRYDGNPTSGYQFLGASYSTDFSPIVTTHTGLVEVEPAEFPNPAVFEERTVVRTIEPVSWPVITGSIQAGDFRSSGGLFWFPLSIEGSRSGGGFVRIAYSGPVSESSELFGISSEITSDISTVVHTDGSLSPGRDGYFGWLSNAVPSVTHDGVLVPELPLTIAAPVVPEPAGLLTVLLPSLLLLPIAFRAKQTRPCHSHRQT